MRLPGLIDVHVHVREPGGEHKEDWATATAAALAGGVTAILAMPNTTPPVVDAAGLEAALGAADARAQCDYAHFLGANDENAADAAGLAPRVAGLKMYLDATYGPLRLGGVDAWRAHLSAWPTERPIALHAEGATLGEMLTLAEVAGRAVHVCHVATREDILLIHHARERGLAVTCEVAPHHLFLCEDDAKHLGAGRAEVRPRLQSSEDRDALWENLDVVDCFATDHAPHTLSEKDGPDPPPGFPGLETMLPLLADAVMAGRLTWEDLVLRLRDNPRRIFGLPAQSDTWVEVDTDGAWEVKGAEQQTRCAWTPFEGWKLRARVRRTVLRGTIVYEDGELRAQPGNGRDLRAEPV